MIIGDRVRLRAIEAEDIPSYVGWFNDPEVTAGLVTTLPMSIRDETLWFEKLADRPVEERPLALEAHRPDDSWTHIGGVGLHDFEWANRVASFGIFIGEKTFWNNGYGSEATLLTLKHGFETLNLNRIYLYVFENNPRAIRVYEKIGFMHEGRLRQAIFRGGRYIDVFLMSILRSEWESPM